MKFINIIKLFIFVAVFIAASYAFAPKNSRDNKPNNNRQIRSIRKQYQNLMAAKKPQVVLLGNSMLGYGIDERGFQALTGKKTAKLWIGGGASAWWYATMKNVICQAKVKPETVILFFRDSSMTRPNHRVDGQYKLQMEDMSNQKEPLLQRIAYTKKMNSASYFLHQHLPIYAKKEDVHSGIQTFIKNKSTAILLNTPTGEAEKAIARVFKNKNMNQQLLTIRQLNAEKVKGKGNYDFQKRVEHSFLPHIIELADKHDINLMFVRIKRRRDIEPNKESEDLKEYIRQLAAYLEDSGCTFQDYTNDPRLKLEHYADGDHLNSTTGIKLFTEILSRQTIPILTATNKADTAG